MTSSFLWFILSSLFFIIIDANINKDIIDCIQQNQCGLVPICHYNIKTSTAAAAEKRISGHIYVLKHGMDQPMVYQWSLLGDEDSTMMQNSNSAAVVDLSYRRLFLPAKSFAVIDSENAEFHRIVLSVHQENQVIQTESSSSRECTMQETCQYWLKHCFTQFVYVETESMVPKSNCIQYASLCESFFTSFEINNHLISSSSSSSDNNINVMPPKMEMQMIEKKATQCLVDCFWNHFPAFYLPNKKNHLEESLNSVELLRAIHYECPLSINPDHDEPFANEVFDVCKHGLFIDPIVDIFKLKTEQGIDNINNVLKQNYISKWKEMIQSLGYEIISTLNGTLHLVDKDGKTVEKNEHMDYYLNEIYQQTKNNKIYPSHFQEEEEHAGSGTTATIVILSLCLIILSLCMLSIIYKAWKNRQIGHYANTLIGNYFTSPTEESLNQPQQQQQPSNSPFSF